ncbi:MAG: hypothetical protein WCG10_07815 [Chlamydiota bacterium]
MSINTTLSEVGSGFSEAFEYQEYERSLVEFEKKLNSWSYYPIASTVTGTYRGIWGALSSIKHTFLAGFYGVEDFLSKPIEERFFRTYKHLQYIEHAGINLFRTSVEVVPVFGNLTTLFYDRVVGRACAYQTEMEKFQISHNMKV